MSKDSITLVSSFSDMTEAAVAKSALEAHGLWCSIQNKNITSLNMLEQNVYGGVRLVVRTDDLEAAKEVLDIKNIEAEAVPGFESPSKSRRKKIAAFLTLLAIVVAFIAILFF
jgi:hypothetical protein